MFGRDRNRIDVAGDAGELGCGRGGEEECEVEGEHGERPAGCGRVKAEGT